MLNLKVLLVSAVAVTTACLFVSQAEPVTGCETQCRLSNVTECQPRNKDLHKRDRSHTDGNSSVKVACCQVNPNSANRCCMCIHPMRKPPLKCCLTDQLSCAQIFEQSSVQEAFCHDQNDITASATVEVPAASSLDSKSNSILPASSLDFKTGTSTSTILTSILPFWLKDNSIMSTDYKPDVSMSLGPLLAGVLSVVGILCIAVVAIVVVLLIIIRTIRKKAIQVERVRECNSYEEVPNNNSNRNPNTATAAQPNAECVSARLFPNPVYNTSPSQEASNTTPLYQDNSFDTEAPSSLHIYEKDLATNPRASNEPCHDRHSPAPYEMPIPHPTKNAIPVASDSREYAQLERSHVYATLEPFIAKPDHIEDQSDDYSHLHDQ